MVFSRNPFNLYKNGGNIPISISDFSNWFASLFWLVQLIVCPFCWGFLNKELLGFFDPCYCFPILYFICLPSTLDYFLLLALGFICSSFSNSSSCTVRLPIPNLPHLFFIDLRKREKPWYVVPLIYAFIGWFWPVPLTKDRTHSLRESGWCSDHWATQPGPFSFANESIYRYKFLSKLCLYCITYILVCCVSTFILP